MEELTNKLNSGNPVIISQIISKLVQIIKSKQKDDNLDIAEFKFLKDKCVCENSAISIVAAEAILNIVRNGSPSLVKSIITDFITIITTTKCSTNVVFLINSLLIIDLQNELSLSNSYKSTFNLRLPQHPFIIMLAEDSNSWFTIFREIKYSYNIAAQSVIPHYNQLYKPVFLYALCNPQGSVLLTFKQKLWTFIIHNQRNDDIFIVTLLQWMQFENVDTVKINGEFLIELADLNIFKPDILLLWQVSLLHQTLLHNFDPRAIILSIFTTLKNVENKVILNPVLLILAKIITLCSSAYLSQLLKLCRVIICEAECDPITINIIKSVLLQWIAHPSVLMSEAITSASSLFTLLENKPRANSHKNELVKFSTNFEHIICTNTDVYFAIKLYGSLQTWRSNNDVTNWIENLKSAPTFFKHKIFVFLLGLFLTKFEESTISLKIFDLILECVEYNRSLASSVLTVILFKLTNTTDSNLHYHLLKAVPKMAVHKDNVQKVVGTIQALNKGQDTLKTFSTTLMLDLWKIDNKCYPYLEKLLVTPYVRQCNKWEFFVTRAYILKELCALKPELYGKEMVAHLSKILNECNNSQGALATALAIDGITLLCKSEIIDAVTTWATLAPLFKTETRVPVIKSLCSLISEFPHLSYTDAYPKLIEEVVAKLWEYIVLSPDNNLDDEVWIAAFDALTHFSIDQIVAQAPDDYFDEESLNLRRSGHVVPGQWWIHFLKNCSESKLHMAGDFFIKLFSLEIAGYLKFVYQVKGTREPVDYSYLPVNSVVRGLSTYVKSKVLRWKSSVYKEVYLQCLRIFSQEYSKPLPPLDWCFLQELFHEPEAKDYCVNIAAHQVMLSGTARRFIVNYIEALTQDHTNEKDVLLIYGNLKFLANSIQPFTLKPFLDSTIYRAVELYKNGDEAYLNDILKHLNVTLQKDDIQEANKVVIAQIISDYFAETDISTKLFELLLESIALFPMKCVDELSSPKSVKEVTAEWFKKAVKIRCYLASNSSKAPLNLLNELMESGSSFPGLKSFLFEEFAAVFKKHKDNTESVLWVLELIGQILAITAEKSEEKELLFLCDVYILATIVFSGHFIFLESFSDFEDMYKLFPRATATLMDVNHWSICTTQALEWFHHMITEKLFRSVYKDMFKQCLQALRHETEFHKNMKWTKYLNVEC